MICAAQDKFPVISHEVCLQSRGFSLEKLLKNDLLLDESHNVQVPFKSSLTLDDPISPFIS